jgi:tripartite-type tricarboxylate transporter receptor subunit TctC
MKRFTHIAAAALVAVGLLSAHGALSQGSQYPNKVVRIIIPFATGGGADTLTRHMLPGFKEALGNQPVIIENKPGAGTIIGTEYVARSAPDGYTLLVTLDQSMTMNPFLYDKLPYDPLKDFVPISVMANSPRLYVVHPNAPGKTLKEIVEYAKANPNKLFYGSGAISAQVIGQQMMDATGAKLQFIPYNGGAPALAAILNGEVQFVIADVTTFAAAVLDGRLIGLAVSGPTRTQRLPGVPTLREAGYGELENVGWWGMFAPAGTPKPIIDAVNAAVVKAIGDKATNERILNSGADPATSTPEQFLATIKRDQERWGAVIKKAGIKAN